MKIEQKCELKWPAKRILKDAVGKVFSDNNGLVVVVVRAYYDPQEVQVVNLSTNKVTACFKEDTDTPSGWKELPNARVVLE